MINIRSILYTTLLLIACNNLNAQEVSNIAINKKNTIHTYAENSLLRTGNWFKIKIDTSGIFKLTYEQLSKIGLGNPKNVRLYSYGGKQLPYYNSLSNYDDLHEIPIAFSNNDRSSFASGDYIYFYGEGPVTWTYNSNLDMITHKIHDYADYTYIYLTDQFGSGGKTIIEIDHSNLTAQNTTNEIDNYKFYKKNAKNLIKSGRTWYDHKMQTGDIKTLNFTFPNIVTSSPIKMHAVVAGRKKLGQACHFLINTSNSINDTIKINDVYNDHDYAHEYEKTFYIDTPGKQNKTELKFYGANNTMEGYINYVAVNAREVLNIQGSQYSFFDKNGFKQGGVWQYNINNNGKAIKVWDITNSTEPYQFKLSNSGNTSSFKTEVNEVRSYIAFDGTNYFSPIIEGDDVGQVANQNLHGIEAIDMVIVTNPLFRKQADTLAKIHNEHDNLSVFITEPQLLYNEFSSGAPDATAIRNFMRMLYHKADSGSEPRYLLLLGDGTYDNKNIYGASANFIPTYQSISSLIETTSYVSDDYYGLLDDDEGERLRDMEIYGDLDVGIGRFPVISEEEADVMISKIINYINADAFGDWRTNICFIGDDQDSGTHARDPESIDQKVLRVDHPEYNTSKIYIDAYNQISTPSGQRYPDVTEAIDKVVDKGTLIIDYVGHGNPRILAHEEILGVDDVRTWTNKDKLPLFVTASCEVGRYDDHENRSLGEWFALQPDGGGIAALTTTRVVFSGSNHTLNTKFFKNTLNPTLRLGDVIRQAKNDVGKIGRNHRNFTLLGDPALRLAVPQNKIIIGNINNNFIAENPWATEEEQTYSPGDTINALSKTHIEGYLDDYFGNPIYESGTLYITIYDKTDTLYTKGHDSNGKVVEFVVQNKVLYKGKASITNGAFSFDFIVPKDINYKFGKGKISLYAVLESEDAIGYSDNIVIGGSSDDFSEDSDGPGIELFMNHDAFVNGGITNENPVLLAKLTDETGINTTGNGFGHNITAILDGNYDKVYILNNYYEGNLDEYNSGEVRFPFFDLEPGYHYIEFKAWDIHNNSSTSSIEFYVHESNNILINMVSNAPNPVDNYTEFIFEHNQAGVDFHINIKIYDIMGNKVTELNEHNTNNGFISTPIAWDGTSSSGSLLPRGLYVYRVQITTPDGEKVNKSSKLMIFR